MQENKLLTGKIWKALLALTMPLLLGNVLQQFYNAIDAWMIGKYVGGNAFAAAGIAGSFMNLCIFLLSGFSVGSSVLFSQLYGSGDFRKMRQQIYTTLVTGVVISLVFMVIFLGGMPFFLRLLRTPAELMPYTKEYLTIILLGLMITWFHSLFSNLLCSLGNTKRYLIILGISVMLNVALDYVMLAVFSWGMKGAALATVLSQLASALMSCGYVRRAYPDAVVTKDDCMIEKEMLIRTIKFGCVSALHQSAVHIGRLCVQGTVNTLSVAGISAYTAAMRLEGFLNCLGASGAQSLTVFISQNHGAGNRKRENAIFKKGFLFMILLAAMVSLLLHGFAKEAVLIFLDEGQQEAILQGISYIHMITFFYVFDYTGNAFVGYFRGTGRISVPFFGTSFHITIRVILSALWISTLGLRGVAAATGIGWICVNIVYVILTARWMREGTQCDR